MLALAFNSEWKVPTCVIVADRDRDERLILCAPGLSYMRQHTGKQKLTNSPGYCDI